MAIRAKKYANKHDKAAGIVGHVQVSGSVEEFQAVLDDKTKLKEFLTTVKSALAGTAPAAEDDE